MSRPPPAMVSELAEVIGGDAAMRLIARYGGTRVWIPLSVPPDHPLVTVVGLGSAAALAARYGNNSLDVPKFDSHARAERDREIRRRYDVDGDKPGLLARAFGLTERSIWSILSRSDEDEVTLPAGDDRQLDLF